MAGTNNIFNELQHFVVNPPPGLFAKLWKKIKKQGAGNDALTNSVDIPENTPPPSTQTPPDEKVFGALRSYIDKENQPPAFDFKKISEAIPGLKEEPVSVLKQEKKTVPLFYKFAAAAAITGIVILIYNSSIKPVPGKQENISLNEMPANSSYTDSIRDALKRNQFIDKTKTEAEEAVANHFFDNPERTGNYFITKNTRAPVLYNDFLFTLTSFNYGQSAKFLSDLKNDNKISLNSYSYINVSDKMGAFFKKIYAVNHKNKSTRKAKKAKAKLAKWKKKDEANFDKNLRKNPLDIIDLSEFLLKK